MQFLGCLLLIAIEMAMIDVVPTIKTPKILIGRGITTEAIEVLKEYAADIGVEANRQGMLNRRHCVNMHHA